MKLSFTKTLICLITLPFALKAQVAPELSRKFSANVITRIYQVTAKVNLPLSTQLQLGELFKGQDSLANAAIAKGVAPEEVNKYYVTKISDLSGILTPLELNDFSIAKDGTASKFAVAIKYRQKLALEKAQVDSMFAQIAALKKGKKRSGTDIKKYEAENLVRLLKPNQYRSLLFIINVGRSMDFAQEGWFKLKQAGLSNELDSAKEIAAMGIYQDNKLTALEYSATSGDAGLAMDVMAKPLSIQKLDVLNGTVAEKELASAIKYRDELKLNNRQVGAMVSYAIQLENFRTGLLAKNPNAKPDTRKNELTQLFKILKTDDQYDLFLNLKNKEAAEKKATMDWVDLRKFNLASSKDSVAMNAQCLKYETDLLISVERAANSKTPEKADSVKKTFQANRPKYLLKLAAFKNTLPRSQFADVINYRKDLVLDDQQIDQLLEKSRDLEFLKLNNKAHGIPEMTKARTYEGTNLVTILNELQYSHYLFYKAAPKGNDYAQKDWLKLKQLGLTKGLDSAKVHLELLNYETNMQVALARIQNENIQKNVFFKKQMEAKKPEYLKQMDLAVKNLAANDDAKKSITW